MTSHGTTTSVTVVQAPACHFCEDARGVLADLASRYPMEVRTVDVASAEGRGLVARHRPAMAPLILLDGAFFSSGRLPRRKLERLLQIRANAPAAASGC